MTNPGSRSRARPQLRVDAHRHFFGARPVLLVSRVACSVATTIGPGLGADELEVCPWI